MHSRNNCCIASFGKRLREKAKFEGFPIKRHEYSKNIKMLFYVLLPRWRNVRARVQTFCINRNKSRAARAAFQIERRKNNVSKMQRPAKWFDGFRFMTYADVVTRGPSSPFFLRGQRKELNQT